MVQDSSVYLLSYILMNIQHSPRELNVSFHVCEVHHIVFILCDSCLLLLLSAVHDADRHTHGRAAVWGGGRGGRHSND